MAELTLHCACSSEPKDQCPDLMLFDMDGPHCEAWANMGTGDELNTLDVYLDRQSLERIRDFCVMVLARPDSADPAKDGEA